MLIWLLVAWLLVSLLALTVLTLAARSDRLSEIGRGERLPGKARCPRTGALERCRDCPLRSAPPDEDG